MYFWQQRWALRFGVTSLSTPVAKRTNRISGRQTVQKFPKFTTTYGIRERVEVIVSPGAATGLWVSYCVRQYTVPWAMDARFIGFN